MIKEYLNSIVNSEEDSTDFDLTLGNLLNRLWACDEELYSELVSISPDIDFNNERHIENTCKMFAIIRIVADLRSFCLEFNKVYFDKRLHLDEPYFGSNNPSRESAIMLFTASQPCYDYNAFYYPHSLHIM